LARTPSGCSQPFESTLSQSAKPRLQLPIPQVPLPQVGVALVRVQGTPHAPQFCTVWRFVSQPLCAALQSAYPSAQLAMLHALLTQLTLFTLGSAAQLLPQAPQLFVLLRVSTSQPSGALPLQFL
jgi:hypothetical protein